MPRLDKSDLVSGLIIIVIGALFAYGATDYRMGTLTRMGPGFVPFGVGVIMVGIGLLVLIGAIGREGDLPGIDLRGLGAISSAILAFALLLPLAGMIPAAVVTVVLATFAVPALRWPAILALAVGVAVGAWVLFVVLLDLAIPVLRNPF